jgi:hypothetical protein
MSRNKEAKHGAHRRDAKNTCTNCERPIDAGSITESTDDSYMDATHHFNSEGAAVAHDLRSGLVEDSHTGDTQYKPGRHCPSCYKGAERASAEQGAREDRENFGSR